MSRRSILVAGGAGYIGSHVLHQLHDAGEKIVVPDKISTEFRSAAPAAVPLIVGDVGDGNRAGLSAPSKQTSAPAIHPRSLPDLANCATYSVGNPTVTISISSSLTHLPGKIDLQHFHSSCPE